MTSCSQESEKWVRRRKKVEEKWVDLLDKKQAK